MHGYNTLNVLYEHSNGFFLGGWMHQFLTFLATDFLPVSLASRIPLFTHTLGTKTIFARVMCHGSFTTVGDGEMKNGER